jgi:hypothetical protein
LTTRYVAVHSISSCTAEPELMRIEGSIKPTGEIMLDRAAWCDLINKRPELRRPAPREGVNPFTKKPTVYRPSDDAAEVVLDGDVIGSASWSQSDEPLVNVSVVPAGLPLVHEWAAELRGVFVADSED